MAILRPCLNLSEPPYRGIVVQKIDYISYWCKKMYHRLEKRNEMKLIVNDERKGISIMGRLREGKMVTFVTIYSKGIRITSLRHDGEF